MTHTSIETLNIPIRARNVLTALGIETVEELALTPDHVLLRIPNCGRKSRNELRASYDPPVLSLAHVQYIVGCVYSRFHSEIRGIEERADQRVRGLQMEVYDLECTLRGRIK